MTILNRNDVKEIARLEQTHTIYNFGENRQLAEEAYEQAESVIRQVEANGSWDMEQEDYGDIDWVLVGLAMSCLCKNRVRHFLTVLNDEVEKGECRQKVAYQLVNCNFFYENYTMYILECFRQLFVKRHRGAKILQQNFVDFITGCCVETEGKRQFKFFAHTPNPIFVH